MFFPQNQENTVQKDILDSEVREIESKQGEMKTYRQINEKDLRKNYIEYKEY